MKKPQHVVAHVPFSIAVFPTEGRRARDDFYLKIDAAKPYRGHNPGQYVIVDQAEVPRFLTLVTEAAAAGAGRTPRGDLYRAALRLLRQALVLPGDPPELPGEPGPPPPPDRYQTADGLPPVDED